MMLFKDILGIKLKKITHSLSFPNRVAQTLFQFARTEGVGVVEMVHRLPDKCLQPGF